MGLVEYSDSDSDSEPVQTQPPPPAPAPASSSAATAKKPFQKLIDRSSSGKIVVSLPTAAADRDTAAPDDAPPAKRARTAATGPSRFSSFGSFLPAPKKPAPAQTPAQSKPNNAPRPGVFMNFKTAAEPAFVRGGGADDGYGNTEGGSASGSGLSLPPPNKTSGPTIPAGQKPEEEVKLVGKPLMFKPLSVARKPGQKGKKKPASAAIPATASTIITTSATTTAQITDQPPPPTPKKKISLFSIDQDDDLPTAQSQPPPPAQSTTYEPLFQPDPQPTEPDQSNDYIDADYYSQQQQQPQSTAYQPPAVTGALTSIADDLSLTARQRRELFGRANSTDPASSGAGKVIAFNMEREYEHNEALRASGAAQPVYNPVRSIAPGKHSLRQVVNMAQSNQAALEESFAASKNKARDAAGRYGWK